MGFSQINIKNLESNTRTIKDLVKETEIMAIVKADAYGHGAVECSRAVLRSGASSLGVATFEEALELREAGIKEEIVILTHIEEKNYREAILNDLNITISYFEQGAALQKIAIAEEKQAKIQIKINTGLNRNGFRPMDDHLRAIISLGTAKNIKITGIYSHLADATDEEFTLFQNTHFNFMVRNAARYFKFKSHISASAGILEFPELNYDMVRPGLVLYGVNPPGTSLKLLSLKPVMSLHSRISFIHYVIKGESVGYERDHIMKNDGVIAVVPIGYADGYPSTLEGVASVIILGRECDVIGKICMDQIIVDVTLLAGKVEVNKTLVTLIGEDLESNKKIKIEEISSLSKLGIREIMCARSSRRIPRVYV